MWRILKCTVPVSRNMEPSSRLIIYVFRSIVLANTLMSDQSSNCFDTIKKLKCVHNIYYYFIVSDRLSTKDRYIEKAKSRDVHDCQVLTWLQT